MMCSGERRREGPTAGWLTHQNLDRQQPLAGVPSVDGKLQRQAGCNSSGVEPGTAGPHLTGIVGR